MTSAWAGFVGNPVEGPTLLKVALHAGYARTDASANTGYFVFHLYESPTETRQVL